jgi:hypothetical protein
MEVSQRGGEGLEELADVALELLLALEKEDEHPEAVVVVLDVDREKDLEGLESLLGDEIFQINGALFGI